ncbi:Fic family protein [Phaeobacter sp. HS012]|uniref:Fic family protein n=1 Tax=unclassified Phaeobacter TaxID=2621772 RepID=UPI001B385E2A|nr:MULTISPECIES: Fic family protein [unclassified Phaeobacter]MBQ4809466.1 Fic family protein [Phaeobacter sp. HS012]MBQ4884406.1 Fic family protein [Phaeobacter sp. HS011]
MSQIWQTPAWPRFGYDHAGIEPDLARAAEAVGEVTGLVHGLTPQEQEDLLLRQIVQEAMASFGIEGVALDASEIEASVVASLRHRDRAAISRRSDAVAELMLTARRADQPLDSARILTWHRLLFTGMEVEDLGRWRRFEMEIVRSATAGPGDVLYKAPPPDRLEAEMAQFLDWVNADQGLPVAVKAALAHLWFESIHPLSDGNGRIGRALIEHVFARNRALPFSLSRQVERDKKAYYAALQAGRKEGATGMIDATEFVLWFLRTLRRAAASARDEAGFILRRNQFFLRYGPMLNDRQAHALRLLFEQGPERLAVGLSAKSYRKITKTSPATATRDLRALEAAGVVTRMEAGGRSTAYAIQF